MLRLTVEYGIVVVNKDLSDNVEVLLLVCLLNQYLAVLVAVRVNQIKKVISVGNTENVLISKLKLELRPCNLIG